MFTLADFPKADRWVAAIAAWQVFGGAFSLVVFVDAMRRPTAAPGLRGVIATFGIIIALFAVLSGLRLRKRRTGAIHQALVVQGLQLIGFSTGSTMMQLTLGPYVYLTLMWGRRYAIDLGIRPTLEFHLGGAGTLPAGIAINLLAFACFMRLLFWELPTTPAAPVVSVPTPSDPPPASGDATT